MTQQNQTQTTVVVPQAPKENTASRLRSLLGEPSIRTRFDEMLGKRAPAFISSIVSAVSANSSLSECEPMSVVSAAAIAASMDLPINSSLGFAHIVPYKGVAQFQIGWKGFIQLAMRSGQYKTINVTPILEGQIANHNQFTGEMEFQSEALSDRQVGFLLYFKLLNGYEKYFYMTREKVLAHGKEYSASFKKGYGMWVDDFEAMALKTVAKLGLSKYGILSVDMQKAVEFDQAAIGENGEPQYVDAESRIIENAPMEGPARIQASIPKPKSVKSTDLTQKPNVVPVAKVETGKIALGTEIVQAGKVIGLDIKGIQERSMFILGKPTKDLSVEEMKILLDDLTTEAAAKGAVK